MILIFLQAFAISLLQGAFIDIISITVMIKADSGRDSYMLVSSTDPLLFSKIDTTLSMLNLEKDVHLSSVIEATIADKTEDLQSNL